MTLETFYQKILNPPKPWIVSEVKLSEFGPRVNVWLTHEKRSFPCPKCGGEAPVYDHMSERTLQHLDTCGRETCLHVKLPRVKCPEHGVKTVAFPLAGPHQDVTNDLELKCIKATMANSQADIAGLFGLSYDRLEGIMNRALCRGMSLTGEKLRRKRRIPPDMWYVPRGGCD